MADQLELGAHVVTAILATWLGVTVFTRARSTPASRVFAWVTLLLALWSTAILVERLSPSPEIRTGFNALEDLAAFLLPAATLHIVLAFTVEDRRSTVQDAALAAAYVVGVVTAGQAILDPGHPIAVDPPRLEPGFVSGATLGWAFIAVRILIFGLAIAWSALPLRSAAGDRARQAQTLAALATVAVAALGGTLRLLPEAAGGPKWVGVSLVTAALLLATYAVLAQGVFLTPRTARQAFRSSFLAGVVVTAYVAVVIGLETLLRRTLQIELPIFTALVIAATIAAVEPAREWFGRMTDPANGRHEATYRRLQRLLNPGTLAIQRPEVAVQPAIERVVRVLGLRGAAVLDPGGVAVATHGIVDTDPRAVTLALGTGDRAVGMARFSGRATGDPFTIRDRRLLDEVAGYIAASLELGAEQAQQATELSELDARNAAVASQGARLDRALARAESPLPRLRVHALGPLSVELGGDPVRQWGGPKAGTRQAEAVFAFLLDRGDRGATKDEIVEVVWPDVDIPHADAAFHRTLVGLRGMLEPGRPPREGSLAIRFHNDRYRLDPSLIEWSDVDAFTDALAAASSATADDAAITRLEEARSLYRGDYLDDCPFYGDSEYVEERRRLLRGRCVDLLVALGERREANGDRPAAAAAFREAVSLAGGGCPPAEDGLERLGAAP